MQVIFFGYAFVILSNFNIVILLSYPIFNKFINVQNKYFSKRHQNKVASNFRDESVQAKCWLFLKTKLIKFFN